MPRESSECILRCNYENLRFCMCSMMHSWWRRCGSSFVILQRTMHSFWLENDRTRTNCKTLFTFVCRSFQFLNPYKHFVWCIMTFDSFQYIERSYIHFVSEKRYHMLWRHTVFTTFLLQCMSVVAKWYGRFTLYASYKESNIQFKIQTFIKNN